MQGTYRSGGSGDWRKEKAVIDAQNTDMAQHGPLLPAFMLVPERVMNVGLICPLQSSDPKRPYVPTFFEIPSTPTTPGSFD